MWNAPKAVLTVKFIALNAYMSKEGTSQIIYKGLSLKIHQN